MTTTVFRIPVSAPAGTKGVRLIPKTSDSIPASGLKHLFRYTEASTSGGFLDAIGETSYVVTTGTGTASIASGGGGLDLTGLVSVVGPTVDMQGAWTILVGMTPKATTQATPTSTLLEVGTPFTNGFFVWYQQGAAEPTTGAFGAYMRASYDGTFGPSFARNSAPFTMTWGAHGLLVLRSSGMGVDSTASVRMEQRKGGIVCSQTQTWDMVRIQGASGSRVRNLPVRIGARQVSLAEEGIIYDVLAIYDRALDDSEISQAETAIKAISVARGRS